MQKLATCKVVADLVRDAGGKLVGRTRLQKLAYILKEAGLEENFNFSYKHYGPFSEALAEAALTAAVLGELREDEKKQSWGTYSIYQADGPSASSDPSRLAIAKLAVNADAVVLELAATAMFLAADCADPWQETARRKPEKATAERISHAKAFYAKLKEIKTPRVLPDII